ncbi:alpha/beta hydrolase [Streptomyces griseocarneus]|uniref:alpha/beta hydrolase n=1 Tax=Streptomyces griseocarneus TaxID=51201 RepID=UPI001CCF071E|nr:alpha/beta hydrolase [Streptomyces griseocarneus]MBZ6474795.1 alpha/beta hydrolase [Streptomyces griseocarneus]
MPVPVDVHHELATAPNGKFIDVYRPGTHPSPAATVLLWHGIGPDERDVLEPLARAVAGLGALVFVPDWRSDAPDGGRAHLLASLEYARTHAAALGGDAERMVLAGWSAGAPAAMGVALNPAVADGWRPAAVVGIASRYDRPARTTGTPPLADLAVGGPADPLPVPVSLVHGTADELMDTACSRELLDALIAHRWPARLEEVRANHAGAIGVEYDPALDRCRPSEDELVRAAVELTARTIAEAAGIPAA